MKEIKFNQLFWENEYQTNQTGWDIGEISTPIKTYIDQIENKEISILIPGAGNSYEAEYLFNKGFKNIDVLDLAKQPLQNLKQRVPLFPEKQLILNDFFNHDKKYDLIIEQTFFCALNPSLRLKYAQKMFNLLKRNGKLIGLLFDFPLTGNEPPFGGSLKEYQQLFSNLFHIKTLDSCYNSIKPREERELFIIFEKNHIELKVSK